MTAFPRGDVVIATVDANNEWPDCARGAPVTGLIISEKEDAAQIGKLHAAPIGIPRHAGLLDKK